MWCDNKSTIFKAENNTMNERTKYFDLDVFFVRQHVKSGLMEVKYIATDDNPADYFTKPHSARKCEFFHRRTAT